VRQFWERFKGGHYFHEERKDNRIKALVAFLSIQRNSRAIQRYVLNFFTFIDRVEV